MSNRSVVLKQASVQIEAAIRRLKKAEDFLVVESPDTSAHVASVIKMAKNCNKLCKTRAIEGAGVNGRN